MNLIFNYGIIKDNELIGYVVVGTHPNDNKGGQLHLFIKPEWRKKWLSKSVAKEMLSNLSKFAQLHNLTIIYSTALTTISPRILEFFGFTEYYKKQPKTYYYLNI